MPQSLTKASVAEHQAVVGVPVLAQQARQSLQGGGFEPLGPVPHDVQRSGRCRTGGGGVGGGAAAAGRGVLGAALAAAGLAARLAQLGLQVLAQPCTLLSTLALVM